MLVFDMDGVLVDVTESYRETIVLTVEHFTGKTISHEAIQDYKNQGGWNNDWLLSQKICHDFGVDIEYGAIIEYFNSLFLGQGIIHRERWLPRPGLLDRLNQRFEFGIFTGRTTEEAEITLNREGERGRFLLVSSNDVQREKPDPEGSAEDRCVAPVEETALRRRHGGRRPLRQGRQRPLHWHCLAYQPAPRRTDRLAASGGRHPGARRHQ